MTRRHIIRLPKMVGLASSSVNQSSRLPSRVKQVQPSPSCPCSLQALSALTAWRRLLFLGRGGFAISRT